MSKLAGFQNSARRSFTAAGDMVSSGTLEYTASTPAFQPGVAVSIDTSTVACRVLFDSLGANISRYQNGEVVLPTGRVLYVECSTRVPQINDQITVGSTVYKFDLIDEILPNHLYRIIGK